MTNRKANSKNRSIAECLASLGFNFPKNVHELALFEVSSPIQPILDLDRAVNPFLIVERSRREDSGKLVRMDAFSFGLVGDAAGSAASPPIPPLPTLPEHILELWKKDK